MKSQHYIHPQALVEADASVGAGSRVWAFAHILGGAIVGEDCNICDHTFIEGGARIGNRVTVKCGVYLWDGLVLDDDVFVGPCAAFTNDKLPRSGVHPAQYLQTVLRRGCSIGANATILPGLVIGEGAMVGAGAVVTRDVPPNAIVAGNPAAIRGYVDTPVAKTEEAPEAGGDLQLAVDGVSFHRLKCVPDLRGMLCAGQVGDGLPFEPKRIFLVMDVPSTKVRGEHAHRECHQFLLCVRGSLAVVVDDGASRQEVGLNDPSLGLYIRPGIWGVQYKYSSDAVLLVCASELYESGDYIRDYSEFLQWKKENNEH